jgi:dihydrofolate reductase
MIGHVLPGRKNIVMTKDKSRKSHDKNLIFTDHPPDRIIDELNEQGFESLVIIGGAIINTLFLKNKIDRQTEERTNHVRYRRTSGNYCSY